MKFPKILDKVWGPNGSCGLPTDDLTPPQQDDLFTYQLHQPQPQVLTPDSLILTKVCETHYYGTKVLHSLHKNGVLDEETGAVDTGKITSKFVSQVAIISVPSQRKLVNLLFFWEEELVRWRLLREEEAEIRMALEKSGGEAQGTDVDLKTALSAVEAKIKMLPSVRAKGETGEGGNEDLPRYEA